MTELLYYVNAMPITLERRSIKSLMGLNFQYRAKGTTRWFYQASMAATHYTESQGSNG